MPLREDRADRARMVREALGVDQTAMAEQLNAAADRLGLRMRGRYDNTSVSKLENGRRDLSVDDMVVYAALDPEQRGMDWLATGRPAAAAGFTPRVGKRPPSPVEPETPRRPSKQTDATGRRRREA